MIEDDKTPKTKRRKGKDKIKERKEKNGKYNSKHIRTKDKLLVNTTNESKNKLS